MKILFAIFIITLSSLPVKAQTRTVEKHNQYWMGYMTSTMISNKYSIWNDIHFVPESFAIIRTGLTRHFENTSITAGYAYLWLTPGVGSTRLIRHEQRPWAQIQFNLPVSGPYSLVQRVRYDARFREKVFNGEVVNGYTFNHRVRFLISLKRTLSNSPDKKLKPYLSISDEVLINFGKEVTNTFDQNRISISFGLQTKKSQYQLGLMNRFVQTGTTSFTANHTLVLWVTQQFDLKNILHGHAQAVNGSE